MAEQDEGDVVLVPRPAPYRPSPGVARSSTPAKSALPEGGAGPGHPVVDRDAAAFHQAIGVEQQRRPAGQEAGRLGALGARAAPPAGTSGPPRSSSIRPSGWARMPGG